LQQANQRKAIRRQDQTNALKADVETTVEMLYPLFEKIWEE
jgi:hypothetical protein